MKIPKFYVISLENDKKASVLVSTKYYSKNYDFVPFALPSRYRPVTVPLLLQLTVTHRRPPLHTVTLPSNTVT